MSYLSSAKNSDRFRALDELNPMSRRRDMTTNVCSKVREQSEIIRYRGSEGISSYNKIILPDPLRPPVPDFFWLQPYILKCCKMLKNGRIYLIFFLFLYLFSRRIWICGWKTLEFKWSTTKSVRSKMYRVKYAAPYRYNWYLFFFQICLELVEF